MEEIVDNKIVSIHTQNANFKDNTDTQIQNMHKQNANLRDITETKIDTMLQNITYTMPDGTVHEGNMTYILEELQRQLNIQFEQEYNTKLELRGEVGSGSGSGDGEVVPGDDEPGDDALGNNVPV